MQQESRTCATDVSVATSARRHIVYRQPHDAGSQFLYTTILAVIISGCHRVGGPCPGSAQTAITYQRTD